MRDRGNPGRAVYVEPYRAVGGLRSFAGMHAHPDPDVLASRPVVGLEGVLHL